LLVARCWLLVARCSYWTLFAWQDPRFAAFSPFPLFRLTSRSLMV